eukprot:3853446-Amphidinium_carterae.1
MEEEWKRGSQFTAPENADCALQELHLRRSTQGPTVITPPPTQKSLRDVLLRSKSNVLLDISRQARTAIRLLSRGLGPIVPFKQTQASHFVARSRLCNAARTKDWHHLEH